MSTDWGDPVARLRLVESVGTDWHNEMIQQHSTDSTVSTVNGYRIRLVGPRWGRLFTVDGGRQGVREDARRGGIRPQPASDGG